MNKIVTLRADFYELDFVLSMIKLHGFGGKTEFLDHHLESFTLIAGMAFSAKYADTEALSWLTQLAGPESAVNFNMGTLVGSYEQVTGMLDEISLVPGTEGVLFTFDDFVDGIEVFGQRIQPQVRSREHIAAPPSQALLKNRVNESVKSGEAS